MLPSWIRSRKERPRPTYFLATETTRRRLARIRWARASSPSSLSASSAARSFDGQIRVLQQALFGQLAALHALGQPDLFLHRQQVGVADLLEVEANGVADAGGEVLGVCGRAPRRGRRAASRGRDDRLERRPGRRPRCPRRRATSRTLRGRRSGLRRSGNAATTSSERRYPWSLPLSIRFVTIASVTISFRRRAASTRCDWGVGVARTANKNPPLKSGGLALRAHGVDDDQCGLALSARCAPTARPFRAADLLYWRSLAELCPYFKRQ